MFKKLKAKIEEGGDSGIENVSFSQRRLPGSAVRTQTSQEQLDAPVSPVRSPSPASREEDVDEGIAVRPSLSQSFSTSSTSEVLPTHITSKPPSTYEALLESRIKQLEEDNSSLKEQLQQCTVEHQQEVERLTSHSERLDTDRTELKLQVVELQLERGELERQLSEREKEWGAREREMVEERERERKQLEESLAASEQTVKQKDKELVDRGTQLSELESKTAHLESRLSAFEQDTENEVVRRLQSEVADLDKTLRSRNLDIQILERRLAHQTRGSQEEYETVVDRQFSLESSYKDVSSQLDQRRQENRQLVKDLEKESRVLGEREREVTQLQAQLTVQEEKHTQLIQKLEEMRSNHERKITEVDRLVQEKDERISELLTNLKQLRGDIGSAHLPDGSVVASVGGLRPPGLARRTATIGVQTSEHLFCDSPDPAILPVNESLGRADVVLINGERATMTSLGPEEELTLLREDQLRLEEEVAEKNKIIKVQQQKILDMKKTLTKELQRSQSIPDLALTIRADRTPSPPPPRIAADVNFQYLKYVVLKFISSKEEESSQLVRAISTLLEFSPQEEKYVRDYLDYKMSWFGSIPPPLTPSVIKK